MDGHEHSLGRRGLSTRCQYFPFLQIQKRGDLLLPRCVLRAWGSFFLWAANGDQRFGGSGCLVRGRLRYATGEKKKKKGRCCAMKLDEKPRTLRLED
jgi:hypothetical protein